MWIFKSTVCLVVAEVQETITSQGREILKKGVNDHIFGERAEREGFNGKNVTRIIWLRGNSCEQLQRSVQYVENERVSSLHLMTQRQVHPQWTHRGLRARMEGRQLWKASKAAARGAVIQGRED